MKVRVYGLLINARNEVLLSHEQIGETRFTKFPGGGLKLGESPNHALEREFREELDLEIGKLRLFHVPEFPVSNYFYPKEQVVLIYYTVQPSTQASLDTLFLEAKSLESFQRPNTIAHEWVSLENLQEDLLTFPADKGVVAKLRQK